jgi:hypothetical protein
MLNAIGKWLAARAHGLGLDAVMRRREDGTVYGALILGRTWYQLELGIGDVGGGVGLFLSPSLLHMADDGEFTVVWTASLGVLLGGVWYSASPQDGFWDADSDGAAPLDDSLPQNGDDLGDERVTVRPAIAQQSPLPGPFAAVARTVLSACFRYELQDASGARELTWYSERDTYDGLVATGYSGSGGPELILRLPQEGVEVTFTGSVAWSLFTAGELVSFGVNYTPESYE